MRLSVLEAVAPFGEHLARHSRVLLGLLNDGERTLYLRSVAAHYPGRHAPADWEVEAALGKAADDYGKDPLGSFFESARDRYRLRMKERKGTEPPPR